MKRELLENLHQYFEQKEERTHEEEMFLSNLKDQLPHFVVTVVSRDDLTKLGFIADNVDDTTMADIADKLERAYCEEGFNIDLDIIAEDIVEKHRCPKCWKGARGFDSYDDRYNCFCGHEWKLAEETGRYVKVEHPEDATFFNDNEIGYDCYNSDDNGARYVPEHIYIAHTENKPKSKQIYQPIQWPESQAYLEWEHTAPKKFERCEFINPAIGFDCNAIWVPKTLLKR